jgi:hypothetical protein
VEEVSSFLRSPLICNTRPSSTCTFTSALLRPVMGGSESDGKCDNAEAEDQSDTVQSNTTLEREK